MNDIGAEWDINRKSFVSISNGTTVKDFEWSSRSF